MSHHTASLRPANYAEQQAWTLLRDMRSEDRPNWEPGEAWPHQVGMPWLTGSTEETE